MKIKIQIQALLLGATALGAVLFASPTASALIVQTVNQTAADANGWSSAIWGTPAVVATSGNGYETTNTFAVRTPNNATPAAFVGQSLQIDNGGILYLKHSGAAAATVNLVMNGGAITFHGPVNVGPSSLTGAIQVTADSKLNSDQTSPNNRDIWLQSPISGSANLTVAMVIATNAVILSGSNSAYSGNWTNSSGFIQVVSGTTNAFGSGKVILVNANNSLVFNSTNNLVVNNLISGAGTVTKQNTNTIFFGANNTFTNALNVQGGLVALTGSGLQNPTTITSNGVLLVANSAAVPSPSTLTVSPNNAQTGGLQLSNSVTLATGNAISVAQRTGTSVAVESLAGNNTISDAISIFSGGTSFIAIQADTGSTLALGSGITCGVTGSRGVSLQGAGNGSVAGVIDNGSATTVSLTKDGAGTWTLNSANTYSGNTVVTNGTLKFGASASIANTPIIEVDAAGKLDTTLPGGLTLGSSQLLRGSGAVLGNVATSAGSIIQVGITNAYNQQLNFSNNLALAGSDTIQYNFTTNPNTNNVLNVAGSLTLGGTTTIQIFLPNGAASVGTFRLINYTGTLLGGGSFTVSAPVSSQTFTLDVSTSGQVNLIVAGVPQNLVWSGDGSANLWDVATTANWTGQVFNQGDNVTFNDSGSASPAIYVSAPVQPGTVTVSNTVNAYTFTNAAITTTFALVKRGTNVLTLAADGNGFNGSISIEAGTLSLGNGSTNGSLGSGSITNNGALVVNRSSGGPALNGAISGSGTVRLTGGGSVLTLTASNSYTGTTTIETGCQLSVLNNYALGSTNGNTVVQSGGSVRFTSLGNWTVAEPLEINGLGLGSSAGALYANTVNNKATWTGPITIGSPSQIRLANTTVTMNLAGPVVGNQTTLQCSPQDTGSLMTFSNTLSLGNDPTLAALTKDGVGTLVLAGNSNLCGSVTVNAGTLQILTTNTPQLGDVTVNIGTLQIGTGIANGALPPGLINVAGVGTTLIVNSSNSFTLGGGLVGAGNLSKLSAGTLTLTTSNSFTGNVTTGSGTPTGGGVINLQNSFGLGEGTVAKTVSLIRSELQLQGNLDIPANISFQTSGSSIAPDIGLGWGLKPIHSLSGNNVIEGSITPVGGANGTEISVDSGTLTLNGTVMPNISNRPLTLSGAGTGILNGAFNNGAGITNSSLVKQGAGTWTMTNVNDYAGSTTIQGGTLALGAAATITNTPTIQLLSNAVFNVSAVTGGFILGTNQTLSGLGTVQGSVAAAGTVLPGVGIGTLTFANNLTLSGLTVMELNRTNTQNADLIATATVAFGGTLTVTNLGDALVAGDTFNLFDGTISGTFAVTNLPALSATNLYWDMSQFQSLGVIKVANAVLPPPNTPTITAPGVSGTNFTMQVNASQTGYNYILQATPSLAPAIWTGIQTNAGTGETLNFTFPITPGNPHQFFRISAQ